MFEYWIKGYSIQTLRNHLIRFVIANESKQLRTNRKGILSSALNMKMNTSLVWHAKTSSSIRDATFNISINKWFFFKMNPNLHMHMQVWCQLDHFPSMSWLCLTFFPRSENRRRVICWKAIYTNRGAVCQSVTFSHC